MTKEEALKGCTVVGNTVHLPGVALDRKVYLEVKKALELIGGTWKGGKVQGFTFPHDPADLLVQIQGGEKRNIKKEFQFFGTPDKLADKLVKLAEVKESDLILEPSAGQGAIVNAIQRVLPGKIVGCFELMEINRTFLNKNRFVRMLGEDFLEYAETPVLTYNFFDKIIANPPFSKNQDIDHIMLMFRCLKPKGRLVTMASKHWQFAGNKKEKAFREWLDEIGAEVIEVESGEFKESGTNIATCIIVIDK